MTKIVWTTNFPKLKRFLGYYRILKARRRFSDYFVIGIAWGFVPFPIRRAGMYKRLEKMRNKHKGKPAFVIGNGPSLKNMDVSGLKDHITIGANGLYKTFPKWGFHTSYLLFEDIQQTELRGPEIHKVKGPIKLAGLHNAYAFKSDKDTLFFNARLGTKHYWDELSPQFSVDFPYLVNLGATITYIGMQWAYHLGCDPVYVIGVDHDYGALPDLFPEYQGRKIEITEEILDEVRKCHFSTDYYQVGDVMGIPHVKHQTDAYKKAREAFEADGRKIYNAGLGGKLDVFERVNFEDIVK